MGLLRNLIILVLILGLILLALKLVVPILTWVFQLAITFIMLGAIGIGIFYLYRKLRT